MKKESKRRRKQHHQQQDQEAPDHHHHQHHLMLKFLLIFTLASLTQPLVWLQLIQLGTSFSNKPNHHQSFVLTAEALVSAVSSQQASSYGCPYPGVGTNCQVNIVAQAPAVPLLSTEFVADEYATLKADTQASYKCDQGYELLGQETLTCLASGRWSAPPPSCVTNIAIGKPTNQSSTIKGGDSRNANDGKLITQHDSKYCTETRVDQSPWWQIDLLQLYEIRSVRLLGRACCNPQLSLHDIEIRIGNSSTLQGNRLCAWYPNNLDEGVARDFQCAHPIIGRFVSIQMVGIESALSLCEVMVFSTKEFPTDRCNVQNGVSLNNSNKPPSTTSSTTTSATTTTQTSSTSLVNANVTPPDNQLVVFNRTCYETQATGSGSFLVADNYCKSRGGSLVHSINNLTQAFISHELERMRAKFKTKLVWIGAKRDSSSSSSSSSITPGSVSAIVGEDESPLSTQLGGGSDGLNVMAAFDEYSSANLFAGDRGLISSGEPSPIFSPLKMARASLYQTSSGAGGSTSRGSQIFGLPSTGIQQQHPTNRSTEHSQRSLIVSQPNQVASFFTPPVPINSAISNNNNHNQPPIAAANFIKPSPQPVISSSPVNFLTPHGSHRSLRPPSLVLVSTSASPTTSPSSPQPNWLQSPSVSSPSPQLSSQTSSGGSSWRWVGDSPSETIQNSIGSFLWADDQPNNYNNQQDCIVLDGAKKWLWNDVTCELDLPWVCQYRPTTCGSPDRSENSTILELPNSTQDSGVSVSEQAYLAGKTITYACPVGHKLAEGSRQRKCQYDGTWSGKAPKCQYVNCGPVNVQAIENGRVVYLNQSQTTYGSQVKYVCYEDYVLVGSDLRQCQSDGRWDGKQPYCAYKWCPVLQQIPNGFLNVSSYSENSVASYQCNSGYKLIGNDTRQCLLGGKWTNQEPFCQYVDCGQPKQIPNGNYQLVNSTTNYLSVALYTCNENYTLVGPFNKMVCSHNNRWTGKEPQCSLIDCGQPQANLGSSFTGASFTVHSSVEYKCDAGFKETSGNNQRVCGLDGQWTGQPISCKYVDCGRVPAIFKGEVSYINGTTYLASQVTYECTPGNRLSGHRVRFCGPDGRWTGTSPKCEEVRCDAPGLPTNGSAIYIGNDRSFKEQSFSVGVTVQYECDYGHVVKGSWSSRLCQANGEWSGEPPICKFVDCGSAPGIENGNYVLKHPTVGIGSVGTTTVVESTRRSSDSSSSSSTVGYNGATNGGQVGTFTYYGTIAHYGCDANFKIQGPAQRECLETGMWRTPLPSCEPIQCPKPEHFDEYTQVSLVTRSSQTSTTTSTTTTAGEQQSAPSSLAALSRNSVRLIANNQWINYDPSTLTFNVGDKLYYSCMPGYELYGGPEIRTCTQYGQWSGSSTPRCRLIDCGKPAPIGQEGRFYLLNETTTFNSLVEYSCVRPFKLVEIKIKQAGNLIETLNAAQAGVIPILTSLPIGVKVCANNGQWMPNDQQPKCVGANSDGSNFNLAGGANGGQFDGSDNTLEGSQRVQVLAGVNGGGAGNPTSTFISGGAANGVGINNNNHDGMDNNLDPASGSHRNQSSSSQSSSLWPKVIMVVCLMVMLSLIILTLICIRSGKKPSAGSGSGARGNHQHRSNNLPSQNGHTPQSAVAAAAAAALQIQLSNGASNGSATKAIQQQQLVAQQQAAAGGLLSNQGIFMNGVHKLFPNSMMQGVTGQQQSMGALHHGLHHHHHLTHQMQLSQAMAYGDASAGGGGASPGTIETSQGLMLTTNPSGRCVGMVTAANGDISEMMMNGKSSSLGVIGRQQQQQQLNGMSISANNMMDSYSRLSIDSSLDGNNREISNSNNNNNNINTSRPNGQVQVNGNSGQVLQQQQTNKTIRHNPNGLVTFVSPAQQQHHHNNRINGTSIQPASVVAAPQPTSQHDVSPKSISTSLSISSSSSPSSSSSARHTTATRLSTTDSTSSASSSSSSTSNNNPSDSGYQPIPMQSQYNQMPPQSSPPSLPAHPPPSHRLQQHHKQLMKQQQQQQQIASKQTQDAKRTTEISSQQQISSNNHHYMEPTI